MSKKYNKDESENPLRRDVINKDELIRPSLKGWTKLIKPYLVRLRLEIQSRKVIRTRNK